MTEPEDDQLERLLRLASWPNGILACWEWSEREKDVPYFNRGGGKAERARRAAYRLIVGKVAKGEQVWMRCGNQRCVNPLHADTGTQSERIHANVQTGRWTESNYLDRHFSQPADLARLIHAIRKEMEPTAESAVESVTSVVDNKKKLREKCSYFNLTF